MTADDEIQRALEEYQRRTEHLRRSQRETAIAGARFRRLHMALYAAAHFVERVPRTPGAPIDWLRFCTAWARRWYHTAAVIKRYWDPALVMNMPLPDSPVYRIAREMFRKVLNGYDRKRFTSELCDLVTRLMPAPDDEWPGIEGPLPLRDFFDLALDLCDRAYGRADGGAVSPDEGSVDAGPPKTAWHPSQVSITIWDQEVAIARFPDGTKVRITEGHLGPQSWIRLVEFADAKGTLEPPRMPSVGSRRGLADDEEARRTLIEKGKAGKKGRDTWRRRTGHLRHDLKTALNLTAEPIEKTKDGPYVCCFRSIESRERHPHA